MALYRTQHCFRVPPDTHCRWIDTSNLGLEVCPEHSRQLWESNTRSLTLQGPRVQPLHHCAIQALWTVRSAIILTLPQCSYAVFLSERQMWSYYAPVIIQTWIFRMVSLCSSLWDIFASIMSLLLNCCLYGHMVQCEQILWEAMNKNMNRAEQNMNKKMNNNKKKNSKVNNL